jgi:hypothetical protein
MSAKAINMTEGRTKGFRLRVNWRITHSFGKPADPVSDPDHYIPIDSGVSLKNFGSFGFASLLPKASGKTRSFGCGGGFGPRFA